MLDRISRKRVLFTIAKATETFVLYAMLGNSFFERPEVCLYKGNVKDAVFHRHSEGKVNEVVSVFSSGDPDLLDSHLCCFRSFCCTVWTAVQIRRRFNIGLSKNCSEIMLCCAQVPWEGSLQEFYLSFFLAVQILWTRTSAALGHSVALVGRQFRVRIFTYLTRVL